MYLIYIDESGNSGTNLQNPQQPVFALGALIIPESRWQRLESDLEKAVEKNFPGPRPDNFEVHAKELISGDNYFKSFTIPQRLALRDDWLDIAAAHELKFVCRAITKKRLQRWIHHSMGAGVALNPHVVAFPLVARVLDNYLRDQGPHTLGIFISDENKEIVRDVEKAIRALRVIEGDLRLGQIVEKGFFIDSAKSLPLQLCDLCTYIARKREEMKIGRPERSIDRGAYEKLEPLLHRGNESLLDVISWLKEGQKKGRPGESSTGSANGPAHSGRHK
ncbi:MAG: DUF3800 domain-containing protein [Opitutales bacterium]|nr:DUF3800 domain-containing protein [Opitutales bacterium]